MDDLADTKDCSALGVVIGFFFLIAAVFAICQGVYWIGEIAMPHIIESYPNLTIVPTFAMGFLIVFGLLICLCIFKACLPLSRFLGFHTLAFVQWGKQSIVRLSRR